MLEIKLLGALENMCIGRLAVVLALCTWVSFAQDLITVPLKIGEGLEYEVSLLPTIDGVNQITQMFCAERKGDFGITDENIDACLEPVHSYLSQYIPAAAKPAAQEVSEPDMLIPLKVGEQEFEISIQPNADSAVATAITFCQQHGTKFGVTEETFIENCLNPVGEYLKAAAEKEAAVRSDRREKLAEAEARARQLALEPDDVEVPMKIGDLAYNIGWNSKRTDAKNMAIKFCTEQGDAIGAGFQDCLGPVEEHLTAQSASQLARRAAPAMDGVTGVDEELRIVKAKVEIAGEEFEFRFEPSEADALQVATSFCVDNGSALGVQAETIEVQCIKPILKVLLNALEQVK